MTVSLARMFDLLRPGMYQIARSFANDPFHPTKEVSMRCDRDGKRIVLEAFWRDGSTHESYLTLDELEAGPWRDLWLKRWAEIVPIHYFDDEAVVAYDDRGWPR